MNSRTFLYLGCYTNQSSVGIHVFDAAEDGQLTEVVEISEIENPSFLAPHPDGSVLYAVSETSNGRGDGGSVFALAIDRADGSLAPIQAVPSGGDAPCYLSVDAEGRYLYVANYASGSVAAFELRADGSIGDLVATRHHEGRGPTDRQASPHIHSAVPQFSRPGFVVVDLGIDQVINYSAEAAIEHQLQFPPGSGPRHLAWHPQQPVGFVVGELDNTISVIEVDPGNGSLSIVAALPTVPLAFGGHSLAAEVRVHPSGTFIYVSNRGHDSIAVFKFSRPEIELIAHVSTGGQSPRSFALHPSGRTMGVANQGSNSLIPFGIDEHTGVPTQLDLHYRVSEPVCVTFVEQTS